MNLPRSIVIGLLLLASPVLAQDAETTTSQDKKFFAAVRSVPLTVYIWKSDFDGFRQELAICIGFYRSRFFSRFPF